MQFLRGQLALTIIIASTCALLAQPPGGPGGPGGGQRRQGGFVPGQQRPTGDPAAIARGNSIYGVSCRGCHGADLRGGDMGGPNLLRSMLALSDRDGEKIVPVIQGSMQSTGMPAIKMSEDDAKATAAYVRSVLAMIGGQGKPPSSLEPPTILVGNAAEGKAYFATKCASCHQADGDLKGLATRIKDEKQLQNVWVGGGARGRFGPAPAASSARRTVTVTVTPTTGPKIEGRLVRIDDFLLTVALADGSVRTIRRDGDTPKVDVHDPLAQHKELLIQYTDKNMHDVTAYLVTLK